jgi:hypothetical protein
VTAGFQVFNSSGVLQIDENYANLALISQGQVTPNTPVPGSIYTEIQMAEVTVTGHSPIIAVRANYGVTLSRVTPNGSSWTFRLCVNKFISYQNGSYVDFDGTPISYYVFDIVQSPVAHGVGLQVFRGDGVCTFDSNYKYFLPVIAYTLPAPPAYEEANAVRDFGGLPFGTYAVVLTTSRDSAAFLNQSLVINYGDSLRALPDGLRVRYGPYYSDEQPHEFGYIFFPDQRPAHVVLIDVSNI